MGDNFKWDDNNVLEYARQYKFSSGRISIDDFKEESKQQENKDWEILSSVYNWEHRKVGSPIISEQIIKSVRRLSDNSVWSVGDGTNYGKIEKFFVGWCGMEVHFTDGSGATLRSIEKQEQPLFTTEDGEDIFSKDEYWSVEVGHNKKHRPIHNAKWYARKYDSWPIPEIKHNRFSTKEAADGWIIMNKPCLSLNDALSCKQSFSTSDGIHATIIHYDAINELKLRELVKSKINL